MSCLRLRYVYRSMVKLMFSMSVCICVICRQTTTMSTQSVTVQVLGGEWPFHTELGPAPAYQSLYVEQSAVSNNPSNPSRHPLLLSTVKNVYLLITT